MELSQPIHLFNSGTAQTKTYSACALCLRGVYLAAAAAALRAS
jgi:hypothetical protein